MEPLCRFIAFQSLRIPAFFSKQLSNRFSFIKNIKKEIIDENKNLPDDIKNLFIKVINQIDFSKDDYKKIMLDRLTNEEFINMMVKILLSKYCWMIFVNNTSDYVKFITSDNPVVISNIYTGELGAYINGVCSQNSIISLPINQNMIIQGVPNKLLGIRANSLKYKRAYLDEKEANFIIRINNLQFKQCYKETYLHPDNYHKILEAYKNESNG